ncbi:MAG: integrin alpha, partial [Planctomycetota bacterium]
MEILSRLILFAVLAPICTSQSVLYTFHGDSPNDLFGTVGNAGDLHGDGFDDLLVGAAMDDNHGTDSGSARVFSGCEVRGPNQRTPAVPDDDDR